VLRHRAIPTRSAPTANNQGLSVRRAESVKGEMVREGMDGSQISIEGKSFHDPLVPTGPGVREPQNRRAVIDLGGVITPKTQIGRALGPPFLFVHSGRYWDRMIFLPHVWVFGTERSTRVFGDIEDTFEYPSRANFRMILLLCLWGCGIAVATSKIHRPKVAAGDLADFLSTEDHVEDAIGIGSAQGDRLPAESLPMRKDLFLKLMKPSLSTLRTASPGQ